MGLEGPNVSSESKEQEKYRMMWKSKLTGVAGNGEFMDKKTAEAWLEKANKENPEIEHWLEAESNEKAK